jgi:hypothetical protein
MESTRFPLIGAGHTDVIKTLDTKGNMMHNGWDYSGDGVELDGKFYSIPKRWYKMANINN